MADRTRPLLVVSLLVGLALVLITTFTTSEYTLTLVMGTLFATALGVSVLMNQPSSSVQQSSEIGARDAGKGQGRTALRDEQNLPDPLELDFDMPL